MVHLCENAVPIHRRAGNSHTIPAVHGNKALTNLPGIAVDRIGTDRLKRLFQRALRHAQCLGRLLRSCSVRRKETLLLLYHHCHRLFRTQAHLLYLRLHLRRHLLHRRAHRNWQVAQHRLQTIFHHLQFLLFSHPIDTSYASWTRSMTGGTKKRPVKSIHRALLSQKLRSRLHKHIHVSFRQILLHTA